MTSINIGTEKKGNCGSIERRFTTSSGDISIDKKKMLIKKNCWIGFIGYFGKTGN